MIYCKHSKKNEFQGKGHLVVVSEACIHHITELGTECIGKSE
jgi:hypothetical protein